MFIDVEENLSRELREVADGLQIPAMPQLPQEPPAADRRWPTLLVAAAIILVLAGAIAVVALNRGGERLQPAPPVPSTTESAPPGDIATSAPTIPYVVGQRLYVDGEQVPGEYWSVSSGDASWLAIHTDYTWAWGRGPKPHDFETEPETPPVLSPSGEYLGEVIVENGNGLLTGFDTGFSGEGLSGVQIDLGNPEDGNPVRVRAMMDDGRVIAQGATTAVLWLPLVDNSVVDLTQTAPGQEIVANTPAGLIVREGEDAQPYLAEISDAGVISRIGAVPLNDDIVVSPGGASLAWVERGSLGGEVTQISTLQAQRVDGSDQATLEAPDGWGFRVASWQWEDDDYLVVGVVDAKGDERMARCGLLQAECVLIADN